jgi:hypothetical protein
MRLRWFCALMLMAAMSVWAAGLAGKWTFKVETPNGQRVFAVELRVDGDRVSGTWGDAQAKGTFREGKLELDFPFTPRDVATTANLKISGKLDGAEIKGTWAWDQYSGTFVAARPE